MNVQSGSGAGAGAAAGAAAGLGQRASREQRGQRGGRDATSEGASFSVHVGILDGE